MGNFNTEEIRKDFSILTEENPPVYFDNACMTLKPKVVIDAMNEYYHKYPACGERSNHRLGEIVDKKIFESRKIVADFINADFEEIIFTRNTTEGINLIAKSFDFRSGDEIIISDKEHNSNLVPWQILEKEKGVVLKIIPSDSENILNIEEFKKLLDPKVKLVSVVFTSNLDGVSNPIKELIEISRQNNTKFLVDAAQAAGHQKIDVKDLGCDFLAFSCHKILGPTGTGILYVNKKSMDDLKPFIAGGGTLTDSTYENHKFLEGPERFEAGLQNYAGIIGLGEAIKYLENIGFENVAEQEKKLNQIITKEIKNLPIKIIGPEDPDKRSGIVNFYSPKISSHQLALLLDKTYNIMTRSGRHCVHSWYNSRNIKDSVRASFYFYNTEKEAEYFSESLKKLIKLF